MSSVTLDQMLERGGLSFTHYDTIISNIYEAAFDPRCLGEALNQLRHLFQANYVTMILRAADEPVPAPMIVAGDVVGMGETNGEVVYLTYHDESAPFTHLTPNQVFTIADLMSEGEWERSTYYLLYCKPPSIRSVPTSPRRMVGSCAFASVGREPVSAFLKASARCANFFCRTFGARFICIHSLIAVLLWAACFLRRSGACR